jgi:hypothetical protein
MPLDPVRLALREPPQACVRTPLTSSVRFGWEQRYNRGAFQLSAAVSAIGQLMLAIVIVIKLIVVVAVFLCGFILTSLLCSKLPAPPTTAMKKLLAVLGGLVTALILPIALRLLAIAGS